MRSLQNPLAIRKSKRSRQLGDPAGMAPAFEIGIEKGVQARLGVILGNNRARQSENIGVVMLTREAGGIDIMTVTAGWRQLASQKGRRCLLILSWGPGAQGALFA